MLSGLEPSKQARCILEIETVQPEGEWCAWRTAMRPRGGALMSSVQTAPGSLGPLRYVFKFTVPEKGMDSADFLFNYASPGGSLRILSTSVLQ